MRKKKLERIFAKRKKELQIAEKRKERQLKYIQQKKEPKAEIDYEHPDCCINCLDKTFNADDSIECCKTGETVFNPFDEVGKNCPKK